MTIQALPKVLRCAAPVAGALSLMMAGGCSSDPTGPESSTTSPLASGHHGDFDAIVVGSGYGGSVAAMRLGLANKNTLVLERGRQWTVNDPTTNATFATTDSTVSNQDGRSSWLSDTCNGNYYFFFGPPRPCKRTTGIIELVGPTPNPYDASPKVVANGMIAWVAAGVGGGSLVNNGISYKPTQQGWDLAFPPTTLPYMQRVFKELSATYYDRALANLAPAPVPPDVLASPAYSDTATVDYFFAAAGYPKEDPSNPATLTFGRTFVPQITDWNAVRDELAGTRVASATIGEDNFGINSGAKKSLDKPGGYLGRAVATGHVQVRPLHTVTDIGYNSDSGLYSVTAIHTDEDYNVIEKVTVTTPHLILSAGSIGTTKLLVHAKATGALPKLPDALGSHFSTNGISAAWRFISNSFVPQGGPAGVKVTDFADPTNPVVIENIPQRVPSDFAQNPQLAAFFGAVITVGIGIPQSQGTFTYDNTAGNVVLNWPAGGSHNVYTRQTEVLTNPALPGVPFILPEPVATNLTLHPLGGVPLGLATRVDDCGVKGYDGLYVVDGSLVPGPSAVANPSLTITALAERCMANITEEF